MPLQASTISTMPSTGKHYNTYSKPIFKQAA
jgi:hypothetical protein